MPLQTLKDPVALPVQEYGVLNAEVLLQQFIEHMPARSPESPAKVFRRADDHIDEILYEANIGGVHYYVICSRPLSPSQVSLSPREQTITRLIAQGLPNKCIADILEISPWTVATYLRRIFIKLNVTSRAAMIARIAGENLLEL